jgi:hypothetical protein
MIMTASTEESRYGRNDVGFALRGAAPARSSGERADWAINKPAPLHLPSLGFLLGAVLLGVALFSWIVI